MTLLLAIVPACSCTGTLCQDVVFDDVSYACCAVCRLVPGALGEWKHFNEYYANPMQQGQKKTATQYEYDLVRGTSKCATWICEIGNVGCFWRFCSKRQKGRRHHKPDSGGYGDHDVCDVL